MPSWKKVIISGSNAALNSLTVSNGITGSLFGTSSWAVNAQTASYVTASNVYGPFGPNSVATASYAATASVSLATTENRILVINKSGNTISKGMVVHLTGSNNSSDTPYVITASYFNDALSANTLGIASQTIAFNDTGYITTEGVLTGIDVTGLVSGQLIYLGATGSITGSAPVAPLHSVRLGQVVRDSPSNNGAIYVRIDNGYELGELHDIIDRSTTSSYGDLLVKSGSVWTNSRQLTGSYGLTGSLQATSFTGSLFGTASTSTTTAAVAGTTNYVSKFTSGTTIGNSQIFDNGSQVGIGTTSPNTYLGVRANYAVTSLVDLENTNATGNAAMDLFNAGTFIGTIGTDKALGLQNDAWNTGNHFFKTFGTTRMFISGSGNIGIRTTTPNSASLHVSGNVFATSFTGSFSGSHFGPLTGTASYATQAVSASFSSTSSFLNSTTNAFIQNGNSFGTTALLGTNDNQPLAFETNTSERMRITATGNVGIGTTTPNATLDVNGNAIITGSLTVGVNNTATGQYALSQGNTTSATGNSSHAQGASTRATGTVSHAEGSNTLASGLASHAEGQFSTASGNYSHAEGAATIAPGAYSHAEGSATQAIGFASHAEGLLTVASGSYQLVVGQYNISSSADSAFIIGNGTGTGASRSNLVFASGSQFQVTGSVIATQGFTGSLFGTASWANNALTASSVTTLNQNVLITGSATVGATSLGISENTLTLGARDNGSEGGQLGLNAPGGTYTSASMIDNYNNSFRILKGTNAGSTGLVAQWNLHNTQMQLPGYTSPTSFTGTTLVGLLGFDSSGNVLTTTTGSGGGGGGVTITNNVDNYVVTATGTANTLNGESGLQYNGTSLSVTGQVTASGAIISNANGAMYFRGGDDAEFWDINVANTVGIYGQQNADRAGLKLGSSGPTLFGSASRFGIGTTTPTQGTLEVNGNVYATSFTGSLFGTSSWTSNAQTASNIGPAISSNVDNYLLTATGTGTINGESRLTFDGTTFIVYGNTQITGSTSFKGDTLLSGSIYVTSSATTLGQFVGNQNGYVEFSVRNTSTGVSASGDIAVYADNGTVSNNYIDMGINNSGMNSTYSYFGTDFGNALDAYLYNVGGNLRIGNATSAAPYSQSFFLFSNPTATPNIWLTGSQVAINKSTGTINGTLDINGNTVVTGSGTFKGARNNSGFDTDGNLSVTGSDGTAGALSTITVGINVGNNTPPYLVMYKGNGGYVTSTMPLGVLQFKGTAGSTPVEGARITAVPTATWGSTSYPTALTFNTVSVNSTTQLERMRIDSTGSVGIGTTSPLSKLHVTDTSRIFDGYGNVNIFTSDAAAVDKGGSIAFGGVNATGGTSPYVFAKIQGIKEGSTSNYNGALILGTTSNSSAVTEKMRITAAGDVGIGLSSPSQKLDVYGVAVFGTNTNRYTTIGGSSGTMYTQGETGGWAFGHHAKGSSGTDRGGFGWLGSNDEISYYYIGAAYNTATMYITSGSSASVGIGTSSPNRKLTVSDTQTYLALNATSYRNTSIGSDAVGNFVVFDDTAGAYRFVINSSGNVGIGTTSPSQTLHVVGSARITGAVYDSSNSAGTSGQVLSSTGTGTSWITSGGGGSAFPYTGSALITGSLGITGSLSTTGSDAFINGVRVGRGKGNIITNTAVGTGSLSSITTGPENTAVGQSTLSSTTTGGYNTAVGSSALLLNTNGGYNTAVGRWALYNNSAGNANTVIGYYAGYSSTGDNNIIIGFGLDYQPDSSGFAGSNTLSIGKNSADTTGLPHIWAPDTVTISTSTNTTILRVDPSTYSGFFLEYVFDDLAGNMRSGTLKGIFTSNISNIQWAEVDELTIGDTSLAIFSVVDSGAGQIDVKLDNTTGATLYCNFTSRLILRQL